MQDAPITRTVLVLAMTMATASGVAAAVTGWRPGIVHSPIVLASAKLPDWSIAEICATDSAGGQCRILEAEAQRTLSGGWLEVPQSFRDACLASLKGPYDRSYRLLSQCLEVQVLSGRDRMAATAAPAQPLTRTAQAGDATSMAAPAAAAGSAAYGVLPTTSVADLFKAREAWGMGKAKDVAAPLAEGSITPLPATSFPAPKGFEGAPTVHALQATPAPQMSAVPEGQIADALKQLFATREGWLKAPAAPSAPAEATAAAPAASTSAAADSYAVLPTTNVADLFKARDAWGMGKARDVAAPLATGAYSPLPSTSFDVPKGFEGAPTVHALEATPAPQLTPVPADQIADAMKKLLAERQSWGKAPGGAAEAASGGAAGSGYAVLPTTDVADLFKAREAWGMGKAKDVAAPLAEGSITPLPATSFAAPKGFDGTPTVHPLAATPAAQLTPVPADQLAEAMKKLLAERAGWGKAPGEPGAAASAAAAGYPILPTTDVADLFKAREAWGMGKAKEVAAPLSAGAVSPLPATSFATPKGFAGEPTVHPLQATPAPQLTAVPADQLSGAMKSLLAERESWGKAPGKVATAGTSAPAPTATAPATPTAAPADAPAAAAAPKSAEAADCQAKLKEAAARGVILFEPDSDKLDRTSNATLDELAQVAKGCKKGRIRVEGHTDSSGRAKSNQKLSERRARTVARYLERKGVDEDRLEHVGFGQEKPIASNDTREGRAQNRRIEFEVLD